MTKKAKNSLETRNVLTAQNILARSDLKVIEYPVPEWDGILLLKEMDLIQREKFAEFCKTDHTIKASAFLITLSAVDENGEYLFNESYIDSILKKNSMVIEKICSEILKMNGLQDGITEEDTKN